MIHKGVCLFLFGADSHRKVFQHLKLSIKTYENSLHSRLVDGTLEKICGEFIDHEKSVFLLALHGSDPAIGGYDQSSWFLPDVHR